MTLKNMIISKERIDLFSGLSVFTGFTVHYNCGAITEAKVDTRSGEIHFFFPNRHDPITVNVSEIVDLDVTYNSQFGISITEDGQYFLIQNWDQGLFCFELRTGLLVWNYKRKKAYELAVKDHKVICRFLNQCVNVIDIDTGIPVSHYSLGNSTIFQPLSDDYYMVGPKRGKYYVLDSNLNEVSKVPLTAVNPNLFDNFIVREANLVSDGIIISGVEYSNVSLAKAIKERSVDNLIDSSRFDRHIAICVINH